MDITIYAGEKIYCHNFEASNCVKNICNHTSKVFGNFQYRILSYFDIKFRELLQQFSNKYFIAIVEDEIANTLLENMAEEILELSIRVLISELTLLKNKKKLIGNTGEERYQGYNKMLLNTEYLHEIFRKYPVLLQLIDLKINNRLQLIREILEDLGTDKDKIAKYFSINLNILKKIHISSGDSHNDGRKVSIISFDDKKIVYKPHGLSPEHLFNHIIDLINRKADLKYNIGKLKCLDYKSHGWQEFAAFKEAESKEDVRIFYHNLGALLAVFYVLCCSDLHNENIIARKNYPAIFDLETLINIIQETVSGTDVGSRILSELASSVLGTMLLPVNFINNCFDFDISGMSGSQNTQSQKWFYFRLEHTGTDNICMIKEPCLAPKTNNTIIYNGELVPAKDFYHNIQDGFTECYQYLENNINQMLKLVESNETVIRHVLRPTAVYAKFLEASTQPKYLNSTKEREVLFSKLYLKKENNQKLDFIESEISALMKHDIPYFSSYMDSKTLMANRNHEYITFFEKTAYQVVEAKLKRLNGYDLRKQLYYISQSISTLPGPSGTNLNFSISTNLSYLENAKIIAEQILELTIYDPATDEAGFLMAAENSNGRIIIKPMDFNLYTGGGIVLFLAQMGRHLGDMKYIEMAEALVKFCDRANTVGSEVSVFFGTGSRIYIYFFLYRITAKRKYYQMCCNLTAKLLLTEDHSIDYVTGISGLIIMLLNIYTKESDAMFLHKAEMFGQYLYKVVVERVFNELTGLAHGYAGYAWALIKLGQISKNKKYYDLGFLLIKKEDRYYSPTKLNWLDKREHGGYDSYWCYGGAGIALSRLKISQLMKNEHDILKEDILNGIQSMKGFGNKSSCLCHGAFGNIDILLEAARMEAVQEWEDKAKRLADLEIQRIEHEGIAFGDCGYISDYSFMQGLAGVGYVLLRLTEPGLACILSLDTN